MTTKNNYHIFEESWKIGSPENGGGRHCPLRLRNSREIKPPLSALVHIMTNGSFASSYCQHLPSNINFCFRNASTRRVSCETLREAAGTNTRDDNTRGCRSMENKVQRRPDRLVRIPIVTTRSTTLV